jgi:cytochrome c oxidase subunit 4
MTDAHHDHDGFAHPVPVKLLLAVFFTLVALTILTVVLNDLPLGALDIWVAMGIATLKASLVCLFFMHMFWEKGFNVVAFFSSLFFVSLFIGFTLMDTGSYRESIDSFPQDKQPDPRIPRTGPPGSEVGFSQPMPPASLAEGGTQPSMIATQDVWL